jgi:hypothetical protein
MVSAQAALNETENDSYITQRSISKPLNGYEYTGSPYENQAFQNGNVYRDGKILASNVALRYNVLRDEFEIKNSINSSNYDAKVLLQSPDVYVKIMNQMYIFIPKKNPDAVGGYFEVLLEGPSVSLYKKLSKEFIEGKKSINSISSDILPMYREKEDLYFMNEANELVELPNSRNGRINSFAQHKKELKQYIREEKINVSKIGDLKKLLVYYNSIP